MKKYFKVSNLDKTLFPKLKITKGDMFQYYEKISSCLLPLVKNHLVVMRRFVHGINEEGFFQKEISDYFPTWLHSHQVDLKKGGTQRLVMLEDKQDVLYLANQNVIEFHAWLSRVPQVHKPDKMIFDLDPSGNDVGMIKKVARLLKKVLQDCHLDPFLMTTGSRGYHIVVSLSQNHTFEVVHAIAKQIAVYMSMKYPMLCTDELALKKREGRVFIDYLRNSYGQTSITPYSLRANKFAGVATPLEWKELSKVNPDTYTMKNIFKRLAQKKEPWSNFYTKSHALDRVLIDKIVKDVT